MAIDGTGAGAIRAGAAWVELSLSDKAFIRSLDRIKARVQAFGRSLAKVGAGLGAAGAALTAPLAISFETFARSGDQLNKMAARTGASVEAISELEYAATRSGASLSDVEGAVSALNSKLVEASLTSGQSAQSFRRLGLDWAALRELDPGDRITVVAEAISRLKNSADQAAAATEVLGGSGAALVPLLQGGAKGVADLRARARELGYTLSAEDAAAATEATASLTDLRRGVLALRNAVGSVLVPALTALVKAATPVIAGTVRWVRENKGIVVGLGALGVALSTAGAAFVAFGGVAIATSVTVASAMSAAVSAVSLLSSAALLLKGMLTAAFAPEILAVTLAVAAFGAAVGVTTGLVLYHTDYLRRMAGVLGGELAGAWETLKETALDAWGGISTALARGDLASAGKISLAGLEVVWRDSLLRLMRMWIDFRGEIVSVFSAMGDVIADTWDQVTYYLQRKFTDALAGLFSKAGGLAQLIGADSLAGELDEFSRAARLAGREIDQEQARSLAARQAEFDAALAARKAAGEGELAPFANAAKQARDSLKKLLAEEQTRAQEADKPALAPRLPPSFAKVSEVLGQASKGGFASASIAQSLGVGDQIQVRQYEVQKEIRDGIKRVEEAVKQGGGVFGGE